VLALSGNLTPPLSSLIGLGYEPLLETGFSSGPSYYIGVVSDIVPGIIIVISSFVIYLEPTYKAMNYAYLIVACSFISLAGVGGGYIGFVLAMIGGLMEILRRRSIPKIHQPLPPQEARMPEKKLA
jgi:hypothetical protein